MHGETSKAHLRKHDHTPVVPVAHTRPDGISEECPKPCVPCSRLANKVCRQQSGYSPSCVSLYILFALRLLSIWLSSSPSSFACRVQATEAARLNAELAVQASLVQQLQTEQAEQNSALRAVQKRAGLAGSDQADQLHALHSGVTARHNTQQDKFWELEHQAAIQLQQQLSRLEAEVTLCHCLS